MPQFNRLTRRAALAAGALLPFTLSATASDRTAPRRFRYEDVNRYIATATAIRAGADPVATFQAYLDAATDDMRVWLGIYPITAVELAEEFRRRPRYYASLAAIPSRIAPLEAEIAGAYGRMEGLHPAASLGGICFLVGNYSAGGTARPNGTMVAVEFFGRGPQTDLSEFKPNPTLYDVNDLVQVVVHEGAHSLQRHLQGMQNYITIYTDRNRMTLRNFAIREGAADYLTDVIAGRRLAARHAFGDGHEAQLWAEFRPIMNETIFDKPGWFQGAFADGRVWPNQMGYYVGYKMAEHAHRSALDQDAALKEVLAAHADTQFQSIADRYSRKFG